MVGFCIGDVHRLVHINLTAFSVDCRPWAVDLSLLFCKDRIDHHLAAPCIMALSDPYICFYAPLRV